MSTKIAEFKKTDSALADLKKRYTVVPDMASKEGYETGRLAIAELRGYRVALDKLRIELNADDQVRIKARNTEANRIKGALVALEDPLKNAKKAEDEKVALAKAEAAKAEEVRIDKISAAIADIHLTANCPQTVADLNEAISRVQDIDPNDGAFDEFHEAAALAQGSVLGTLGAYLEAATAAEIESARVAEQAKAQALVEEEQKAAQAIIDAERAELNKQREAMAEEQAKGVRLAAKAEQAEKDEAAKKAKEKAEKAAEKKRIDDAEKAETARLGQMIADRENFEADSGRLLVVREQLDQLKEYALAVTMETEEADGVIDAVVSGLENLDSYIVNSSVVRSQECEAEAA